MKRFLVVSALLLFVASLPAAAPPALNSQGGAALNSFLKASSDRGDVPGVVVLVAAPDRVLYHEAFGKMSITRGLAMKKDTIFNIASMTKAVTAVAAMILHEEWRFSLSDPASMYIPALADVVVLNPDGTPRAPARPITVVQGVAAASLAGLICAVVGFGWVASAWSNWSWSPFVAETTPAVNTTFTSLMSFATAAPQTAVLLAALAAGLVLMPVAVYLALSE